MISPTAIRALPPGKTLHDDVVTGLQVRSFANGRTAYYLWFRTKLGQARHPKLGDCAVMSLADARALAKRMLLAVANGRDPTAELNNERRAPTMAELWGKFWSLRASRLKGAEDYQRMWDRLLAPKYAQVRVQAFSYEDMVDLHRSMEATPYQANRLLQMLSVLFNFAERPLKWREVYSNPCRGIKHYPEVKRRRYATPAELQAIGVELERAAHREPQAVAFLYLLLYTGARPGEIETAQRSWLEALPDGAGVLRLPDSKTGQRDLYLPAQAMRVIAALPAYPDGTICGRGQPRQIWKTLRAKAGCPDLRMYPDLRRSFASVSLAAGASIDMVGGLLGHRTRQTTLVYARLMEEAAASAVATSGAAMASLLGAEQAGKAAAMASATTDTTINQNFSNG